MKKLQDKAPNITHSTHPQKSHRFAARLEGVVRNKGIKPKKKEPKHTI